MDQMCFLFTGKVIEVDYKAIAGKAHDLVLWRKPLQTGVVFGALFLVEIVLMSMSFLSVVGYAGLALLFAIFGFRTFLKVTGKPDSYGILDKLDHKLELTSDEAEKSIKRGIANVEFLLESLRELILVNNVTNSIKFGLALYLLTYLGARFNLLTLCLICTVCVFVFPKVYELKKKEIDQLAQVAKEKLSEVQQLVMDKLKTLPIPGLTTGAKDKK
ncbi:Reticulon-like protein, partial [Cichlidogyrus casuarinus]